LVKTPVTIRRDVSTSLFSKMTKFSTTFISQISFLTFQNGFLFAANSSELLIYRNEEMLKSVKLSKKIHFVKVFKDTIYCLSGQELTRIEVINWNNLEMSEKFVFNAKDWIVSVEILDGQDLVLLFANNYIHHYSKDMNLLHSLYSSKLLLYSGQVVGKDYDSLLIASGTIMNTCVIWDTKGNCKRKLMGHEGVLHGIQFSDDLTEILTVSDDRTARLYDLKSTSSVYDEEGFEIISNHTIFKGHTGRVWKAKFADKYVVTIAEDATCRIWDRYSQRCLSVLEGHGFKNVWSLAIDPTKSIIVIIL
jgi:WD repeat-containing protein 6